MLIDHHGINCGKKGYGLESLTNHHTSLSLLFIGYLEKMYFFILLYKKRNRLGPKKKKETD